MTTSELAARSLPAVEPHHRCDERYEQRDVARDSDLLFESGDHEHQDDEQGQAGEQDQAAVEEAERYVCDRVDRPVAVIPSQGDGDRFLRLSSSRSGGHCFLQFDGRQFSTILHGVDHAAT